MRIYRMAAGLLGWFALILQYALIILQNPNSSVPSVTFNFFSFFTILSNILAALVLTVPVLFPGSRAAAFLSRPVVEGGVALAMGVTGLIYVTILAGLWDPAGWQLVADGLLHHVMPVLFLVFWLMRPKGSLGLRVLPKWLALPLAYGVYTVAHGPVSGFYPYPFMDVAKLGLGQVLINMVLVTVVFALFALVLLGIDRLMGARQGAI